MVALALARACVLAPLGEELLFRGALYGWIRRRLGARTTIGVTAVLFAVIHPLPILWPAVALLGVGAGWAREKTGSIVPSRRR